MGIQYKLNRNEWKLNIGSVQGFLFNKGVNYLELDTYITCPLCYGT